MGGEAPYVSRGELDPFENFRSVNAHVLICGSSGSGKSFLASRLFQDVSHLVLFKPDSSFPDVPLASEVGLPDLMKYEPHDVADAYLYALKMEQSGIMAASLVPVLVDALLWENSKRKRNFGTFLKRLESYRDDKVLKGVAAIIRQHFSFIYGAYRKKRGRPRKGAVVMSAKDSISFAGLGNLRSEFGAELFLRDLYTRIGNFQGDVLIDEFHHVGRKGSVIDTLLREYRVSGRLIAITQALSDLDPSMLTNFGYIFLGRSVHSMDLDYLKKIDERLPGFVSRLPPRVFLSLTEFIVNPDPLPLYAWIE